MSKPRRQPTDEQRQRARELRDLLLANTAVARELIEMGEYDGVNEALVAMYTTGEHEEFNTFNQWRKLGRPVRKGERCRFPVWGEPIDRAKPGTPGAAPEAQPGATTEESEDTRFWPVCHLFSNAQVS